MNNIETNEMIIELSQSEIKNVSGAAPMFLVGFYAGAAATALGIYLYEAFN